MLKIIDFDRSTVVYGRSSFYEHQFNDSWRGTMPKLNTVSELELKKKLSMERVRRLQKDIMREKAKQKKFDAKMKMAPRD